MCERSPAAERDRSDGADVAFVSNVDPEHLTRALAGLDPATTLFIVTSKTFTTGETLANAHAARAWLAHALGAGGALGAHFVAITSNDEAARAFGVTGADILPIWDWVGGRYSLWSPVGLPVAIRCGWDAYAELLAGAASIDRHFRETPLERNLPVLLALVDFWNARVLGFPQRIVAPYAEALKLLPSYLQQLDTRKQRQVGAARRIAGRRADGAGALGRSRHRRPACLLPVAAPGHVEAAVEFIVPVRAAHPLGEQQALLIANALAQAQALMRGKSLDEARAEVAREARDAAPATAEALAANRVCPATSPRRRAAAGAQCAATRPADRAVRARTLSKACCSASTRSISGASSWARRWPARSQRAEKRRRAGRRDASTRGLAAHVNALDRPR